MEAEPVPAFAVALFPATVAPPTAAAETAAVFDETLPADPPEDPELPPHAIADAAMRTTNRYAFFIFPPVCSEEFISATH